MDALARAWLDAVERLGGRRADADAAARELATRYGEAQRRYHNAVHVAAVLRDVAALSEALDLEPGPRAEVSLAACAHDVVYDASPGVDERASAEWAVTAMTAAGLAPTTVARVRDLVLMTLTHACEPDDVAAGVLLDADLAILASPPPVYDRYVVAVRAEYAAVTDPQWRSGRGEVLRGLLARDRLYVTAPGQAAWERPARDNIRHELVSLGP